MTLPLTSLLSALVCPAEADRVVAAELKQDRLAVQLARPHQLVPGPLAGDGAVEKTGLLKRPDRPTNLRFGESKIQAIGQLAPINWETRLSTPEGAALGALMGSDPRQSHH